MASETKAGEGCDKCGKNVFADGMTHWEQVHRASLGCWNCCCCMECCDCGVMDECKACLREYPRGDGEICDNCGKCCHCCFLCDKCDPHDIPECRCDGSFHKDTPKD